MAQVTAALEGSPVRFLGPGGSLTQALPDQALQGDELLEGYRFMVLTRLYDTKAVNLQRTGQLGTFPSSLGQEAATVGLALPMRPEDVLCPSYREHGAYLRRGVTLTEMLLYWGGDERGSDFAGPRGDLPVAVPIATQALHAAGVAAAFKLRDEPRVAVGVCGDGATSKGDFYEAINLAGVWKLPLVMVVINNQWAISVPRTAQTAAPTLAHKALAAGIPGEQVDGNQIVAVHHAMQSALATARGGGGSTLLELITYRMGDHTTADDARRYRPDAEVSAHWKEDPIARLRSHLTEQGLWDKGREEALLEELNGRVEAAVEEYLATPQQPPTAMFDHLYAELPPALQAQRDALAGEVPRG